MALHRIPGPVAPARPDSVDVREQEYTQVRPQIPCLDEPLGCLDEDTHGEVCELLRRVCREVAVTTLHVTHSMSEARKLADRIFRIENGAVTRVAG